MTNHSPYNLSLNALAFRVLDGNLMQTCTAGFLDESTIMLFEIETRSLDQFTGYFFNKLSPAGIGSEKLGFIRYLVCLRLA